MYNNLFRSKFSKNVLTLATGTTIAQAIPIGISPILTRIYSPKEFGVLALFLSFTAILTSIVNGKYEMAIMLPKSDRESLIVVKLALYISTSISAFCLLFLYFAKGKIALILNEPKIENWLLLIPFSIFITGFYNALNFYNTRNSRYSEVSKSQVSKSVGLSIGQIGFGLIKLSHGGLILGKLLGDLFGNLVLFRILRSKVEILKKITFDNCKVLARRYKKFPLFSLPSVLLNSITLNSTNFFITSLFSAQTLGFYSLSNKILGLPSVVIGRSIGQVYYQEACKIRGLNKSISPIFLSTFKKLSLISVPIFVMLYFIIAPVFEFVFGADWSLAGTMAQIIIPLVAFRFVSSTLSSTIVIVERQELSFIINVILLSTSLSVFYIANKEQYEVLKTLKIFTYALCACYASFCCLYYYLAKKTINEENN